MMTEFLKISAIVIVFCILAFWGGYCIGCNEISWKDRKIGFEQGAAMVRDAWDLPGDKDWRRE